MNRPLADDPTTMLGLLDRGFVFSYRETCEEVCSGIRCSACRGPLVQAVSVDDIREELDCGPPETPITAARRALR